MTATAIPRGKAVLAAHSSRLERGERGRCILRSVEACRAKQGQDTASVRVLRAKQEEALERAHEQQKAARVDRYPSQTTRQRVRHWAKWCQHRAKMRMIAMRSRKNLCFNPFRTSVPPEEQALHAYSTSDGPDLRRPRVLHHCGPAMDRYEA